MDVLEALGHTLLAIRDRTIRQQRQAWGRVNLDNVCPTIPVYHHIYTTKVQARVLKRFECYSYYFHRPATPTYYIKAPTLSYVPSHCIRIVWGLLSHCSYSSRHYIDTVLGHFVDQLRGIPTV